MECQSSHFAITSIRYGYKQEFKDIYLNGYPKNKLQPYKSEKDNIMDKELLELLKQKQASSK